jgi:hypothetical protein
MTNAALKITYEAYLQAIQDGAMAEAKVLEQELETMAQAQGKPNPILSWRV